MPETFTFEEATKQPESSNEFSFEEASKPAEKPIQITPTPYDKYRLAIAQGATPENYSELPSLPQGINARNPDWDFVRAAGPVPYVLPAFNKVMEKAGDLAVGVMDIPTKIRNRAIGATDPTDPRHKETLAERTSFGRNIITFPHAPSMEGEGTIPQVSEGIANLAADTATALIGRPQSAVLLGATPGEGALSKIVSTGFGASAAAQVPSEIAKAFEVVSDPKSTLAEKTAAIGNPLVQGVFAKTMLKHGMGGPDAVNNAQAAALHGDVGIDIPINTLDYRGRELTSLLSRTGGRGGEYNNLLSKAREISEAIRSRNADNLQHALESTGMGPEQLRGLFALVEANGAGALEAIRQGALRGLSIGDSIKAGFAVLDNQEATGRASHLVPANEIASIVGKEAGLPTQGASPEGASGEETAKTKQERKVANASKDRKTKTIYESLSTQSRESQRQMSAAQGGEGVQSPGTQKTQVSLTPEHTALLDPHMADDRGVFTTLPDNRVMRANHETGQVEVDPVQFAKWVDNDLAGLSDKAKKKAVQGAFDEEDIHLKTDREDGEPFWNSLSPFEQAILKRQYLKGGGEESPQNLGLEAIRNRIERANKMTRNDFVGLALHEKWTAQALDHLATIVSKIRRAFDKELSAHQDAILNKVQENIKAARSAVAAPGAAQEEGPFMMRRADGTPEDDLNSELPPLHEGERVVLVRRPDGSVYRASYAGKQYDVSAGGKAMIDKYGGTKVDSVGRVDERGQWSHGLLKPGEKIIKGFSPYAAVERSGGPERGGGSDAPEEGRPGRDGFCWEWFRN